MATPGTAPAYPQVLSQVVETCEGLRANDVIDGLGDDEEGEGDGEGEEESEITCLFPLSAHISSKRLSLTILFKITPSHHSLPFYPALF